MRYLPLLCFLILAFSCTPSIDKSRTFFEFSVYEHPKNKNIPFSEIQTIYKKNRFLKGKQQKIYKRFGNTKVWLHYKSHNDANRYLTFSNTYIDSVKVFLLKKESVTELEQMNSKYKFTYLKNFYRHPVWQLPSDFNQGDIFIALKNDNSRVRLLFKLESKNEFLKRIQTEYVLFASYFLFLFLLSVILLFFSLAKKRYSILFYVGYIVCMAVEFLAGEGLGVQFIWSNNNFLASSARTFSQTLAVLFVALFFYHFYNYKKKHFINKHIFKWCAYAVVPFLLVYVYKMFDGESLKNFYVLVWIAMKIIVVIFLLNHIYLVKEKLIPRYLVIGFLLPSIAHLIYQYINPAQDITEWKLNFLFYFHYFSIILELLLFTSFIFRSIATDQRKYDSLLLNNQTLKLSLRQGIFQSKEKEREKILSEIHDSFGGYLEALKLRILTKNIEKISTILEAFHKEYRHLLHNLYSPRIKAYNFTESLESYARKLSDIRNAVISCKFEIQDIALSQEICLQLYRCYSEIITNAIKHAKASKIAVKLWKKNNQLLLEVKDNGVGFDTRVVKKDSFGIKSIKNRVHNMKGTVKIVSSSKGTNIKITIPYGEKN